MRITARIDANAVSTLNYDPDTFSYEYEANTYGLLKTITGPVLTVTNTYEAAVFFIRPGRD